MELPFNAAADRNKEVIGDALSEYLAQATTVLEIGSGSGQHAVYLCRRFSHLQWQVTDQSSYLEGLAAVVEQSGCENIQPPTELQAGACVETGNRVYSFVYSANTAHIMGINEIAATFEIVSRCLSAEGLFALYGPFKENGLHNSDGNIAFDKTLRSEDPKMGIRDIAELEDMANATGMKLHRQIAMPSNNRILLWQQQSNVAS